MAENTDKRWLFVTYTLQIIDQSFAHYYAAVLTRFTLTLYVEIQARTM
jgi:hypothetical protein